MDIFLEGFKYVGGAVFGAMMFYVYEKIKHIATKEDIAKITRITEQEKSAALIGLKQWELKRDIYIELIKDLYDFNRMVKVLKEKHDEEKGQPASDEFKKLLLQLTDYTRNIGKTVSLSGLFLSESTYKSLLNYTFNIQEIVRLDNNNEFNFYKELLSENSRTIMNVMSSAKKDLLYNVEENIERNLV